MKSRWLAMAVLASSAWAQDMPVYYDYVENGVLKGGKFFIDPDNPVHRSAFGLDRAAAAAQVAWPVTTIIDNGPPSNRVDVVIVGDGYTAAELTTYANHVDNVVGSFFTEEPLAAYLSYFNVHRVDVESNESGVDEPDSGIFKDTALDMAYDCAGIPRLLCINLSKAFSATSDAPDVDQTLAIANSMRYGGAGYPSSNLGTLPGANASAVEVALHEFGHSFADLADEYTSGGPETYSGSEPFDANVSIYDAAEQAAQQRKWYRWLDLPNVGAFEGGNYSVFGIYRPTSNSKMRALNRPFEEVNVEQFVINMYELVSPIDDATPASVDPRVPCTTFFVTPMQPLDHVLDIQWSLDGADVAGATSPNFTADWSLLSSGVHDVAVRVADNTSRVRDETVRSTLMTATRQWQIEVPPIFGDVFPAGGDGVADIDDVLCALDGFSNFAGCPASDLFPCGGDGLIDIDDVLAMLNAFAGSDDCPGICS